MKILVADDSKTNLVLTSAALKKLGHQVLPAKSGNEAIEIFQRERPDLIILDVVMENMDGYECATQIRLQSPEDWIPIIFLSSNVDDESIAKGINAGGDDYLTKPFSEITLAAKIKAMQRIADMRYQLFETTKKLSILSATDALTGVYNRFQFDRTIRERIARARRMGNTFALFFLDLDHFKTVNDTQGHQIGDLLLKNVAKRLLSCLRVDDFIARMGGDEFAIILEDGDSTEAADTIAQKILEALSPAHHLDKQIVHISSSIGIAFFPVDGDDQETLIQNADMAMYYAKDIGRNNFQYFSEELHEKRRNQLILENGLKFAVDRQEIIMTYQPILNLQTKKMVGMEALAIWNHPTLGTISPDIFIPIAEENGLIDSIGKWIFNLTFQQCSDWVLAGHNNFKLSINISSRQLLQKALPQQLKNLLYDTKIPAQMLELELTETAAIARSELSEKNIREIHNMGIGISLDDFGTGYSSINHLKILPISTIKIDKSFVSNIKTSQNDLLIVKSLTALGKSLGFNVIAEGIENEDQLKMLLESGCPQGQGYYLGKTLTAGEMSEYLNKIKS